MATSFPTDLFSSIDIPEVSTSSAQFVYNFFVRDEKLNEMGSDVIDNSNPDMTFKQLSRKVPRYVKFDFVPVTINSNQEFADKFVSPISKESDISDLIVDNLSNIQSELEISSKGMCSITMQDPGLASRISKILNLSADMRAGSSGNSVDKAAILNAATSAEVSGNVILEGIVDMSNDNVSFVKENTKDMSSSKFRDLENLGLYMQIGKKYAASLSRSISEDNLNPYASRFGQFNEPLKEVQDNERLNDNPNVLNDINYTSSITPISYTKVGNSEFRSGGKVVGYIVDKQEILPDGSIIDKDSIILTRATATTALDAAVKYGSTYSYSVRAIALVQILGVSDETGEVFAVSALVTSRSSSSRRVTCVEKVPPPPPVDMKFVWDYRFKKLNFIWNFPNNPQRDIKRFQVFRRRTVDEPFELLMEYDFDDSVIPTPRTEMPKASSILAMRDPLTFYIDDEFTKDSTFIYALCAIDAHDLSSNYSMQYRVSFDVYKNSLIKELVSPSGAPKPYPNFYLLSGLTVDSMKDSNRYSAKIYFDPEYLSVVDQSGEDLGLLTTLQEDGHYDLQFINVDRQKSKVVTIKIDDLRS